MDYNQFVEEQIVALRKTLCDGLAIYSLGGGVGGSVLTVLGYRAFAGGSVRETT